MVLNEDLNFLYGRINSSMMLALVYSVLNVKLLEQGQDAHMIWVKGVCGGHQSKTTKKELIS
jgi:hypothetical protein